MNSLTVSDLVLPSYDLDFSKPIFGVGNFSVMPRFSIPFFIIQDRSCSLKLP